MKIAVASQNGEVAQHFGHCEEFLIVDTATGLGTPTPNPGHKPGFLPNFLADMGVEVIIAGGMGQGACDIFNERGIRVVTGATGDSRVAAEAFRLGTLLSTGSVCEEHGHSQE